MRQSAICLAAVGGLALTSAALAAQDFSWKGRLAAGKTIEIRGVNGSIRAQRAGGTEVVVTARKRARRSNPDDVQIKVVESSAGVTICAVYPSRDSDRPNECRAGGGGRNDTRDNDTEVNFEVQVPAGVGLVAASVNGSVRAEQLASDVEGSSVNGDVDVVTTGSARASSVNGSVRVTMGALWRDRLELSTVNGGISVTLPAGTDAEVEATTVNGSIDTDFPMTVSGRMGPRTIRGTIGKGGRALRLETVNGSIQLRKAS
jgi:hypothetical protein